MVERTTKEPSSESSKGKRQKTSRRWEPLLQSEEREHQHELQERLKAFLLPVSDAWLFQQACRFARVCKYYEGAHNFEAQRAPSQLCDDAWLRRSPLW